eukprot:4543530-Prymnesium_polylepis.2
MGAHNTPPQERMRAQHACRPAEGRDRWVRASSSGVRSGSKTPSTHCFLCRACCSLGVVCCRRMRAARWSQTASERAFSTARRSRRSDRPSLGRLVRPHKHPVHTALEGRWRVAHHEAGAAAASTRPRSQLSRSIPGMLPSGQS